MKTRNKVQLIGYLGRDPLFIEMKDGTIVVNLRLATDHWTYNADGTFEKHTDWHTVKMWGKQQIESFRNYIIKGSHLMVEGRLSYRTNNTQAGQTVVTEIIANEITDLDR